MTVWARAERAPYLGQARGGEGIWPFVARVFGALPFAWLARLGALLGFLAGVVLRIRRRHVEDAMRSAKVADPKGSARAMYRSLGASACELLWLGGAAREVDPLATIEPASAARLDAVLAEGRGAIVAATHTGNWDLAACAIARRAPLLVVTKRLHAPALDAFWQGTRAGYGVLLAPAAGASREATAVLARGGLVAMMIDQVPSDTRHAVRATFLGREAYLDRAPAVLAARARVPLVVAAARRTSSGTQELFVLDVIDDLRAVGIDDATRRASRALEAFVRKHPSEWLWLHRRWKVPAAGKTTRGEVDAREDVG